MGKSWGHTVTRMTAAQIEYLESAWTPWRGCSHPRCENIPHYAASYRYNTSETVTPNRWLGVTFQVEHTRHLDYCPPHARAFAEKHGLEFKEVQQK